MKFWQAVILSLVAVVGIFTYLGLIEAFQRPQQEAPGIVIENDCTSRIMLNEAPNGLAGFEIWVNVPVDGISTSAITISDKFALTSIAPVQTMIVAGVDLQQVINPGDSNVLLFSVAPCVDEIGVRKLDDDNGDRISQ